MITIIDAINAIECTPDIDTLVQFVEQYLIEIGEDVDVTRSETYEETMERLRQADNENWRVMEAAREKWWQLEDQEDS